MASLLVGIPKMLQTIVNTPELFRWLRAPAWIAPTYNWLELLALAVFFYHAAQWLSFQFPLSAPHLEPSDWAVVTGGTDGIGKEYALTFFRRGLNVMVISRTKERVDTTVAEVKASAPAGGWGNRGTAPEVVGVTADFSKAGIYGAIGEALKGKSVGVLVNNVGMSYPNPPFFRELGA